MKKFESSTITREEYKTEIEKAARSIPLAEIQKAMASFKQRLRNVEENHGNICNK